MSDISRFTAYDIQQETSSSFVQLIVYMLVVGMPEDAMQRKTIDRMASFGAF